jgi:hypothetical protein
MLPTKSPDRDQPDCQKNVQLSEGKPWACSTAAPSKAYEDAIERREEVHASRSSITGNVQALLWFQNLHEVGLIDEEP